MATAVEKFKVVDNNGVTTFAGIGPKDAPAKGLDRDKADSDCKARNERAEALGIEARYSVEPL